VRLQRASNFLLSDQEKVTKEKATLLRACRAAPGKSVSRGRAFRQGSCPDEKEPTSMPTPLRACRPRLTALQGIEGQQQQTATATGSSWSGVISLHPRQQDGSGATKTDLASRSQFSAAPVFGMRRVC
jgi:hypothetical protein